MATEKQQNKISKVMREFYAGKLTTHGNKVTDVSQAKAIALSEAGVSNKKSSAKKKMAEGGQVISKYDDEKYMSKRHYLRDTIESFFGKQNVYFNSADWGGMPVWTVKGDLYEGTFIVMGDEDDVILMTRQFDSELGENVNNTLMQVQWQDINGLNDLLNKAMIIKNSGSKMAEGGSVDSEGIDLFEDYDNIPEKVQKVLTKYAEAFEEGDYDGLKKANKAVEKVGYTFEYGLDGIAYDLRPIGTKGKSEMEEFAKGGNIEKDNKEMIASQVKEAKHHSEELSEILKQDKDIEAWVVAKMERATTDLSDVTHYLDGKNEKYAKGGSIGKEVYWYVPFHAHEIDGKITIYVKSSDYLQEISSAKNLADAKFQINNMHIGYSEGSDRISSSKLSFNNGVYYLQMGYALTKLSSNKATAERQYELIKKGAKYANKYAKGGGVGAKLSVGKEDFSFLLNMTDKELSKRLDLIKKQQQINRKQYFDAFSKKENTKKIEEAGQRLANQERAIIEARIKVNKMAEGGGVGDKMKHPKSYYKNLPDYNGYKWIGFEKGKHIFSKKESKGYATIKATEEDLTNGNIEFMTEHGLSHEYAQGGGVGELYELKKKVKGFFPEINPDNETSYYLWLTPNSKKISFIIERRSVYSDVGSGFYVYDKAYNYLGSADHLSGFENITPIRITKKDLTSQYSDGGGVGTVNVSELKKDMIVYPMYGSYSGKKGYVVGIMPDKKTVEVVFKNKVGNDYAKFLGNELTTDMKYANGGGVGSSDTPKVWVGEWSLYNEGKLIGEWIDLSEYSSGEEVMDKIQELLDKWTKETGELREEYAVFDYENFPSSLYSEQMGEDSFDKVINAWEVSQERDIPMDVIGTIISEYDPNNIERWIEEKFRGQYDSDTDFAYDWVDMMGGIENVSKNDLESYFDYESFGRDLVINNYKDIDGYYFDNYEKGGKIPTYDLKKYMKSGSQDCGCDEGGVYHNPFLKSIFGI